MDMYPKTSKDLSKSEVTFLNIFKLWYSQDTPKENFKIEGLQKASIKLAAACTPPEFSNISIDSPNRKLEI